MADVTIVGIDDGFLIRHQGPDGESAGISYSPDGFEWSELSLPAEGLPDDTALVSWLGAGLVWNERGFWRVTSAGFERLPSPTLPRQTPWEDGVG